MFAHQPVEQSPTEKAVLRALVVSSPDPVALFRVDADGYRHVYVDARLCEPRGVARRDVEGLTVRETSTTTVFSILFETTIPILRVRRGWSAADAPTAGVGWGFGVLLMIVLTASCYELLLLAFLRNRQFL